MSRPSYFLALAITALSCSTQPTPTREGTWQVTVLSLDSGTLAPSTFSLVVTGANDTSYSLVMPPLHWSAGSSPTYDTLPHVVRYQIDSDPASLLEFGELCKTLYCMVSFWGRMNESRDTVALGGITFWDTVRVNNALLLQTAAHGLFTARK